MAIIYRTAGPWGAGKGANLVAGEVDGNFYDLNARLMVTEGAIPELVSISFFEVVGNSFYIHMTNGTIQGPFALPQLAWNFRGEWVSNIVYYVNDVVTHNGSVYMVMFSHVSGATFDPNANDGLGHPYYALLLTEPSNVLPTGGNIGDYLYKQSSTDYDCTWSPPVVFPAQALREAPNPTYTVTLDNIASYVRCINGSGCTVAIPNDVALNFPLSTEISFRQCTDSPVILQPASSVLFSTIKGFLFSNGTVQTGRNGAVITAKKVGPNSWDVFGLLAGGT
jgi:hypothetical protein